MPGIEHFLIDKASDLKDFVNTDLLELGAVYLNHHRLNSNKNLKPGDYLRVHTQPKRYPTHKINWEQTIIHEDKDLIVIDKPYGIPVHATLDNAIENVLTQMSKFKNQKLYHTHRLDIGTQGILILTKTPESQKEINNQFLNKRIKKYYVAKTDLSLVPQKLIHYMQPSKRAPKILSNKALPNYKRCELIIHEDNIELITGRSHQIRAQLSTIGAPIIGDTLYGGRKVIPPHYEAEFFFLACTKMILPNKRTLLLPQWP
ncbi:MAG: hypothetical protein A4S09_11155 [Proteobacteria bacterium SG_bin7]|nr:MAG: hypothetical protein A4S09_11155 [Proteobacteria bacterium SG_bin7]